MSSVIWGLVEGIGIADKLPTPSNLHWFTEITAAETVVIPCEKPDMEQLLSVMVEAEIISIKVAKTPENVTSHEGQHLSGRKLIIELKLRQQVKYVADEPTQSVHSAHFDHVIKSVFVVVPCNITFDCEVFTIEEALRLKRVIVTPYIEDIYARMLDERAIFKNVTILVNVELK